jgi:hypothetical protein
MLLQMLREPTPFRLEDGAPGEATCAHRLCRSLGFRTEFRRARCLRRPDGSFDDPGMTLSLEGVHG